MLFESADVYLKFRLKPLRRELRGSASFLTLQTIATLEPISD
jgi:hypothetical protein